MKRSIELTAILGIVASLACGSRIRGGTDGSTHFWDTCAEDAECGSNSECICGRCTIECTASDQCSTGGTTCVAVANVLACTRDELVCVPNDVLPETSGGEADASVSNGAGGDARDAGVVEPWTASAHFERTTTEGDEPPTTSSATPVTSVPVDLDAGPSVSSCLDSAGCPWTSLERAPFEYSRMTIAHESKFYAFNANYDVTVVDAGPVSSSSGPQTEQRFGNFVYDVTSNQWSELEPPPANLWGVVAGVIDGKVYVVQTERMFIYDIESDAWSEGPTPPERLDGPGAGVVGSSVFVFGGNKSVPQGESTNALGEQNRTTYVYSPTSGSWNTVADAPNSVNNPASCVSGNRLFTFGLPGSEWNDSPPEPVSLIYTANSDVWSTAPGQAAIIFEQSCVALDDDVYVFGGAASDGKSELAVKRFTPESGTWAEVATLPAAAAPTARVIGDSVYVLGNGYPDDVCPFWRFTPQP